MINSLKTAQNYIMNDTMNDTNDQKPLHEQSWYRTAGTKTGRKTISKNKGRKDAQILVETSPVTKHLI